ncbi:hypothetical protein BGZ63DRAFT_397470 [Mariannaea sp. PMI_226]|nr:hypothetical protein BGZ63DRAFT_397470 [Mariannaea sp. PMI_226]
MIHENILRIPGIIRNQSGLKSFQFPPPTDPPISILQPPQLDGLKCQKCSYLARNVQKMQAHCRL